MAFSITLRGRCSCGNTRLNFYDVTDAQSGGSTINTGLRVDMVKAVNNTDSSDTFKETIDTSTSANNVKFTSATNDDDGVACVWGR